MLILGIESTAHTFGVAILDDARAGSDRVLANCKRMATTEKGGLIPAKLADHHEEIFDLVLAEAFEKASAALGHPITWKEIGLIAVSDAPGIGHALRIGCALARTLALRHRLSLVGVNHCIAHLEVASLMTDAKDPVLLYCSGANTQVIAYDGGKYRIFGETLDTGVGNFLDTLAREMGLGFPGGPKIEQLALACTTKESLLEIPYTVKGMDVAFSGILTNVTKKLKESAETRAREGWSDEAIAYSVQEIVFAMLVEVAERAIAHCSKSELVLGGGVACNKRLQEMCRLMCEDRGVKCYAPENQFLVDNAAMIAWAGKLMFDAGVRSDPRSLAMKPYERTDDVLVTWRN